jgi:hypothetical protein
LALAHPHLALSSSWQLVNDTWFMSFLSRPKGSHAHKSQASRVHPPIYIIYHFTHMCVHIYILYIYYIIYIVYYIYIIYYIDIIYNITRKPPSSPTQLIRGYWRQC